MIRVAPKDTQHRALQQGTFTGKELEVDVKGTVDDAPVSVSVHYVDGREVTVQGSYRGEDYLSVAFRTELKDISIGIRKVGWEISVHFVLFGIIKIGSLPHSCWIFYIIAGIFFGETTAVSFQMGLCIRKFKIIR